MPFAIALPIASKSGQGFADSSLSTSSFTEINVEYGVIDSTVSGSSLETYDAPNSFTDSTVSAADFQDYDIFNTFEDCTVSAADFEETDIQFGLQDSTVSSSSFSEIDLLNIFSDSTVSSAPVETFDMPGNFDVSTVSASDFQDYDIFNMFEDSSVSGGSFEDYDAPNTFEDSTVSASDFNDYDIFNTFEDSTVQSLEAIEYEGPGSFEDSTVSGGSFEAYDAPNTFADGSVSGSSFEAYDAPNTFEDATVLAPFGSGFDIDADTSAYIEAVSVAGDTVRDSAIAPLDSMITSFKGLGLKANTVMLLTFTDRANGLGASTSTPSFVPIFNRNNRTITATNIVESNRVTAGIEFTGTEYILLGVPLSDTPFTNFTYHLQAVQTAVVQPSNQRWMLSNIHSGNVSLELQRIGFSSTTGQFRSIAGDTSGNAQFTSSAGSDPGTGVSVGYTLTAHTDTFNQSRLYTNGTLRYTSTMTNNNATTGWAAATSTVRAVLGCRRSDNTEIGFHARFTAQVLLILDVKLTASEVSTIQSIINTFVSSTTV